jgi:hypothetical protein
MPHFGGLLTRGPILNRLGGKPFDDGPSLSWKFSPALP